MKPEPEFNIIRATFRSASIEHEFRQSVLPAQKRTLKILIFIGLPAMFLFTVTDIALHSGPLLLAHIVLRCIMGTVTVMALLYALWQKDEKQFDRVVVSWFLVLVLGVAFIDYWRPQGTLTYVTMDLFFLFCTYSIIPLTVIHKHVVGICLTVSCLLVTFLSYEFFKPVQLLSVAVSIVMTNIIGSMVAYRLGNNARQDFFMARQEKLLRKELEQKLEEIDVLTGLLPICAWCKKIRVNDDNWEEIEVYLSGFSKAEFSHGICPECSRKIDPGE